jgi:hypothetical protein
VEVQTAHRLLPERAGGKQAAIVDSARRKVRTTEVWVEVQALEIPHGIPLCSARDQCTVSSVLLGTLPALARVMGPPPAT